ncbi:MAG TPA: sugar nucleotide-binding protein, partial [Dehalococcoidia bacterium]|nr:sugar nucleotide-binding protein [Dehalococcoidia bacterium]
ALEKYWIVRSSWLYGAGRMSFPEKIIKAAQEQGSLQVVTDEIASPTWTDSLAEGIARLIKHPIWGIYHLTNTGKCSRFDWAKAILQEAGLGDIPIRPTTLAHYPNPYRKPPFTVLGNQKAAILGIELPHWQQALADYFKLNSQVAQTS